MKRQEDTTQSGSDRTAILRSKLARRFGLTETEAAVAESLLQGLTYGVAARGLGMSPNTVHAHVKAIHRKAGVATNLELAALFYETR